MREAVTAWKGFDAFVADGVSSGYGCRLSMAWLNDLGTVAAPLSLNKIARL